MKRQTLTAALVFKMISLIQQLESIAEPKGDLIVDSSVDLSVSQSSPIHRQRVKTEKMRKRKNARLLYIKKTSPKS